LLCVKAPATFEERDLVAEVARMGHRATRRSSGNGNVA
jgi:hypothetical protein